ncbi:MAG: hypothetical protein LUF89_12070 [Ruminococcus sp.]|nr:hypothetical protein [Ruminococcus sp.]
MDATTFPISMGYHIFFGVVACLFFLMQYYRLRRPYQLILAIAMPASLLIYIDTSNQSLFHVVGLFELVMLLGAIILSIVFRIRRGKDKNMSDVDTDADANEKINAPDTLDTDKIAPNQQPRKSAQKSSTDELDEK